MSAQKARQELVDQLEMELRGLASRIHLLTLSRTEGTQELTAFLCHWAKVRHLNCAREVFLGATRPMRNSGFLYRGYLDFVIDDWLAIEIDSANKRWSLSKLDDALRRGLTPVWIRWCSPQKLCVPPAVRLILLPTRESRSVRAPVPRRRRPSTARLGSGQ